MAKRKSILQKEKLLTYSFKLFKVYGYNNTTTRQIAAASGMDRGLLHYYFKQKEDILFELYIVFIDELFNFIISELKDENDGLLIVAIFDILYFKIIFSRKYLRRIVLDVLDNRNLTKTKIMKTMEIYKKTYENLNVEYEYERLFISTALAIGGEVELILNKTSREISMPIKEIIFTIIRIQYLMQGIEKDRIERIIKQALYISNNISLIKFEKYFSSNAKWFSTVN